MKKIISTGCLLASFGLARTVQGYLSGAGSSVTGNLSAAAPYGIPPDEFGKVTKRVSSTATFNMTGYNVFVNAEPSAVAGWTLTVNITTDVSLVNAADRSNFDIEATTLSIEPPGGKIIVDPSWKICAVVFTGVANHIPPSTTIDGTCNNVLSGSCIQAIESGSSGMDDGGNCTTYTLPAACASDFPAESMRISAVAIDQSILDAKRFYAYGSPKTQTANVTAYQEAVENVWPVVTLFGHLSASGTRPSLNTTVQCLRASNKTAASATGPMSGAGRSHSPPNRFTVPGLSLAAFLAALYLSL